MAFDVAEAWDKIVDMFDPVGNLGRVREPVGSKSFFVYLPGILALLVILGTFLWE